MLASLVGRTLVKSMVCNRESASQLDAPFSFTFKLFLKLGIRITIRNRSMKFCCSHVCYTDLNFYWFIYSFKVVDL